MVWYFVIGMLAAFGFLCALWLLLGGLLGSGRYGILICPCSVRMVARYCLLRDLRLLQCPLLLVGGSLSEQEQARLCQKYPEIEFCQPEDLPARLELERKYFD